MSRGDFFKNFDEEKDKAAVEAASSDAPAQKRSKWSPEFQALLQYKQHNGANFIDMIPFKAEEDFANLLKGDYNWRLIYKQHANIGPNKETFVCPRSYGEQCPICDEYDNVRFNYPGEKGSDTNKEYHKNVVLPLAPKARAVYSIVDRSSFETSKLGVQYMDMSTFYIEENIGKYAVDRRGDKIYYFHPDSGRIVHYTWEVDEDARKRGQQSAPDFAIVALEAREMPDEKGDLKPYVVSDEELAMVKPLGKWIFNIASAEEIREMMEGTVTSAVDSRSNAEKEAKEQLDEVFGKRGESEPPFDVEEKETAAPPSRSRSRSSSSSAVNKSNPEVEIVKAMTTVEELDEYCEANEIDLFASDYDEVFDDFKNAVIEYVNK